MAQWFLNLKLRIKLLFAFGSLLLLSLILVIIFSNTLKQIEIHEKLSEQADGVTIGLLQMNSSVRYFILEGFKSDDFQSKDKSASLDTFVIQLEQVNHHLDFIRSKNQIINQEATINAINQHLFTLNQQIDSLRILARERGFKDYGVEGQLRKAIHKVEKSSYPYDKATMLTLRRHEKDFFLRRDLKYQKEFNTVINEFIATVQSQKESEQQKEILQQLSLYRQLFNEIVAMDTRIGLKESEGMKSRVSKSLTQLKQTVIQLRAEIKSVSENFKKNAITWLIVVVIVQLLAGTLLAILYAGIITKAIKELRNAINDMSEGRFPPKLISKSNEEIGQTKNSFNQLLERITAATQFADHLGQGKLDQSYDRRFDNDVLALSLIKMQSQLKEAQEINRVINWGDAGVAQLNEIMKTNEGSLNQLGDQILRFAINYLNVNQGALYIVSEEEQIIERIATYAYDKKKFIDEKLDWGFGLIGQCALEKQTIILTDVPRNYIRITSGLGDSLPSFVVIVPLKIREKIMGVLELASFIELKAYEVQFLERISENIAALLTNRQLIAQTNKALEELKLQAEQQSNRSFFNEFVQYEN